MKETGFLKSVFVAADVRKMIDFYDNKLFIDMTCISSTVLTQFLLLISCTVTSSLDRERSFDAAKGLGHRHTYPF